MSSSSQFSDFIGRIMKDKKTAEKLKRDLDNLSAQRDEFEEYFNAVYNPKKLLGEFRSVNDNIKYLQKEAEQVAAKANEKLQIAFIGHTSAGKTTLINALLGEEILPVHCLATTFCSVAISGTNEKEWSATVQGTDQKLEEKDLQQILHQFGTNHESFMEKYKITAASVIELKWPFEKCRALADHVILYDTPGIGELRVGDDVDDVDGAVTELLRSMDVVVAVMDIHSPGLKAVQTVVKGANCNYTLAAFTKWDKYTNRSKAGEQVEVVQNKKVIDTFTKQFQGGVDDTGEVFFVDAKSHVDERKTNGASNFRSFESHLVTAANGKLKSERLHDNLLSVITKSKTAACSFSELIKDKRAQEMERILKEQQRVQGLDGKLGEVLDEAKKKLRTSLENVNIEEVTNCIDKYISDGLSDEEIVQRCQQKLNQLGVNGFSQQFDETNEGSIIECVKNIDPNADADSFHIGAPSPPWGPNDFKIDDSYTYSWYSDMAANLLSTAPYAAVGASGGLACDAILLVSTAFWPLGIVSVAGGVAISLIYATKLKEPSTKRRESLEEFIKRKYSSLQKEKYQDAVASCFKEVEYLAKGKSSRVQKSIQEDIRRLNDPGHTLNKSYQHVCSVLTSMKSLVCE